MTDGDGEGVGGVGGLRRLGEAEEAGDHELDLLLLRQAVADDAGLDAEGGVFGYGKAGRGGGKEGNTPNLAQFEGGLGIDAVEDFLDGNGIGAPGGELGAKLAVDLFEAHRERLVPGELDAAHGAADEMSVTAGFAALYNPVARNFSPAVDAKNAHCGQFTAGAGAISRQWDEVADSATPPGKATLNEEGAADHKLTQIAMKGA